MLEDLHKMHGMDYSVESLMVKRLGILLSRKNKVKKIMKMIDEISNKV
jgi:hypothetical protein